MNVLVLGGTLFVGVHLVNKLLEDGHEVTIATRGQRQDSFGNKVDRLVIERTDETSIRKTLIGRSFDVVYDNIALSSNAVKSLLSVIQPPRYIMISTMCVYEDLHIQTKENEFDPLMHKLVWGNRSDFSYAEAKRQAECALYQEYTDISSVSVRLPVVVGKDDYTKRLEFYVENVIKVNPIYIDNIDNKLSFIDSYEAGCFLAWLCTKPDILGCINACSNGCISIRELLDYVEKKTGISPILLTQGINAPYNGIPSHSLDTSLAAKYGYRFINLQDYIYSLLDTYIIEEC